MVDKLHSRCKERFTNGIANGQRRGAALPNKATLTANDIEIAESLMIKHEQRRYLSAVLSASSDDDTKGIKGICVAKLNPFVRDEMLRVGGRLRRADVCPDSKNQVIVPKESLFWRSLS